MIAHITHGSDAGGVMDYLTSEVSKNEEKLKVKSETEKGGQSSAGKVEKQSLNHPSKSEIFLGETADGHSQYPRQSRFDDLDDDYQPNQRWRVIGGNLSAEPKDAVKELNTVIAYRPDIERPIWHASLSAHLQDKITAQKWREISRNFLNEMGFKNSSYIIIQHRDREHDHIHIVTSRVDVFGRVNDAWRERHRGQEACVRIEHDYWLRKVTRAKAGQVEKKKQTYFKEGAKNRTKEKVAAVLNSMEEPNVAEFVRKLEAEQVLVETKFSAVGEVEGLKFTVREAKNRHRYLRKKMRKEAGEKREQEAIKRLVEKANAKSENPVQLVVKEEFSKSSEVSTIAFRGGQLGNDYKWESLKNSLNYSPKDNATLVSANARAAKKDFQVPKRSESEELSLAVAESSVAETFADLLKSRANSVAQKFQPTSSFDHNSVGQKFGAKIRSYIPKQIFGFTVPAAQPTEKANSRPPLKEIVKSIDTPPRDKMPVERKIEKPQPTVSTFDLAMEKQQMAAEISEVFRGVGQQGFLLAGDEILQLNLDLRAKEIYSEFFLDGQTITGIRFSKQHRKTGEVMTFKGSELNITFLRWRSSEDLAIKTSSAAPKSMFSERRLALESKSRIVELNSETVKFREGRRKVSPDTVFQANILDAKANKTFENYFENLALPADDIRHEDLIVLNRLKQYFLNREKFAVTATQSSKISRIYNNIEVEKRGALEKIASLKKTSGSESAGESAIESFVIDSLKENYNFREKIGFFERYPKTELDAELLISSVLSQRERIDAANDLLDEQTAYYWQNQPLPTVQKQAENYLDAVNLRINERGMSISPLFNSFLNDDLRLMNEGNFLQPSPRYAGDINDLLIPEGVKFMRTVANIKAREGWQMYNDKEAFQNKLNAATFILANGNKQEKDDLLDKHIDDLSEREAEILKSRIFAEAEVEPPTAEHIALEQVEM